MKVNIKAFGRMLYLGMEFTRFKIKEHNRYVFESEFRNILSKHSTQCNQWEFNHEEEFLIVDIPTSCIERMTNEDVKLLESFII